MTLPTHFIWTRYGTEAGQETDAILRRKERERQQGHGVFLWGIGNSIAPGVRALLMATGDSKPQIVFSPMLSKPKAIDTAPARVVKWTTAIGLDGKFWQMPNGSLVTSRLDTATQSKRRHYALVCQRQGALEPDDLAPRFSSESLRNFASGNPVGHSQVTSVVRKLDALAEGPYIAAISASLVYPYVLELSDPVAIDHSGPSDLTPSKSFVQMGLYPQMQNELVAY